MTMNVYFDGAKSIELAQYPDTAWEWLTGEPDDGVSGIRDFYKAIPWLYRGVELRAGAVAKMPFEIYKGDTVVDQSNEYTNVVGFLPDPVRIFKLIDMSLTLLGSAYLFNIRNDAVTLDLKYLNPTTITPIIDEVEGLTGFTRRLTEDTRYDIEDIVYFWGNDPYVEIGEPKTSPGKAALVASGVLANVDEFVASFFKRGAIKPTILGVPAGTPVGAREELQKWYSTMLSGIRNAFATKVVNADAISATTIGEGVDSLQNTELTKEKREDIATAIGVPQTILFSNAANYATAKQDDLHFYDKTVVPDCDMIQGVLNEQIFEPAGYRLQYIPDTLDIFQEDEKERAAALLQLVQAEMPLEVALRTLGFELTDEDWAAIEAEKIENKERAEAFAERFEPSQPKPNENDDELRSHLDKWQRKAIKRFKAGKGAAAEFDSDVISNALNASIAGALDEAKTLEDIGSIFKSTWAWMNYP